MSDPSPPAPDRGEVGNPTLSRRGLFAGGLAGAAALYGLSSGGAAARSLSPAVRSALAAGTVSFGSNGSDPVPKKAYANVFKAFTKKTGISVKVNTVDHNTFQEQINTYLQGQPQDVFTWFAGYRMQFFASKGLLVADRRRLGAAQAAVRVGVPERVEGRGRALLLRPDLRLPLGGALPKERRGGSTATRSRRPGISSSRSRKKMKADGLTPIAFTDKDGWPAMGTFDIINMRLNGYDFHVRLMAGKARWDGPQVKRVFNTWREILPYTSDGALGLTWQEGAQQLANKEAGMYMLGTFVGQQFTGAVQKDIDFFAYPGDQPEVGPGLDRCPDRRVLHGQEGEQLEGGEGPALVPRDRDGREHLPRLRPERRGREQERQQVAVHGDPEEVSAADRRRRSTSRSTSTATRGPTSPRR